MVADDIRNLAKRTQEAKAVLSYLSGRLGLYHVFVINEW